MGRITQTVFFLISDGRRTHAETRSRGEKTRNFRFDNLRNLRNLRIIFFAQSAQSADLLVCGAVSGSASSSSISLKARQGE